MNRTIDYLDVDGQKIKVELFEPSNIKNNQAVLFLHGWTGRPNTNAALKLAEYGYTALTVIFRGHLGSDGSMSTITRQNALDDAVASFDYLQSVVPRGTPICVVGTSYGSYTATVLSSVRELNGLSLRVAANYPDAGFDLPQIGQGHENPEIAKWRNEKRDATSTKSLRAIQAFKKNIQIFEAEYDEIIPHQTIKNYVDAISNKAILDYHLMEGWTHSLGDDVTRNKDYQELLLKWLQRL